MEQAINSIQSLLRDGDELAKSSLGKAREGKDSYAGLCERVNSLGTALAHVKTDFNKLNGDKEELSKLIDKMDKLDDVEIQNLANILQNSVSNS